MTTESSKRPRSVSKPVVLALAALVAAAALIGGPVTMAYWNDKTDMTAQIISSGSVFKLDAATPTVTSFTMADANKVFSTVSKGTGLIPGKLGQRLTYVFTAGASNSVQGYISGTITTPTASSSSTSSWAAIYQAGYLTAQASALGKCTVNTAPTVSDNGLLTWTIDKAADTTLKAGEMCTITLDLSLPAVKVVAGKAVDVSRALMAFRGITTLNPLADFTANAVLTQVPRAGEK